MEYLVPSLVVAAAVVAVGLAIAWAVRKSAQHPEADAALALLQNQLNANVLQTTQQIEMLGRTVTESVRMLSGQVSQSLADAQRSVSERLESTGKVIGDVRQQLGQMEESSRRLVDVSKDIAKLEDILKPPKLRGNLGEFLLGDLLAQVLPPDHFHLQYRYRGGETVDAVIQLQAGLVPIDAKFPLENFRRMLDAGSDTDRKAARKAFIKDVKSHIDAIASKYIRMDENTFDFALMYIPAENVYYETVIRDDDGNGELPVFTHALKRHVIPVSPSSFYVYLQTIVLGLKGMRVEERSRDILEQLSRLRRDFDLFGDTFRLVGQHLDNAVKKYADAQKRYSHVESKVEQVDGLAQGLSADTPAETGSIAVT
jgi:DNA recombination protein RmuC